MKRTALLIATALLASAILSGCPDPKLPKAPPSVPEPKAAGSAGEPLKDVVNNASKQN